MRTSSILFGVLAVVLAALVCKVSAANADVSGTTKTQEYQTLDKAYSLLKYADGDYKGHRAKAMRAVEAACHEIGYEAKARHDGRKAQIASDEALQQAANQLNTVKTVASDASQDRLVGHIDRALEEIKAALDNK